MYLTIFRVFYGISEAYPVFWKTQKNINCFINALNKISVAQTEQIGHLQKERSTSFQGKSSWDNWMTTFLQPMSYQIIDHLKLKVTDIVLDIATGTGELGLTIANVVKNGKVIGSYISEKTQEIDLENAKQKGVRNFETRVCDICHLPFNDATFDAVTCRFGFMFFPDMLSSAREMVRVLKPGGRLAVTVLDGPTKNVRITSIMAPIIKNLKLTLPPTDAPGMFRCATPGLMTDLFKQAGLTVSEKEIDDQAEVESIEFYWEYMNYVFAPIVALANKASEAVKTKIKNEILNALKQKYPDDRPMILDYDAILIYGEK